MNSLWKCRGRKCNIALVASEFNHFIVQQLVDGALDALGRNGVPQAKY